MRKLAVAAVVLGALGFAAPALAGPGQCYDRFGRPIGPVYDTDYPNYNWINAVISRGGSCTGVATGPRYYGPYYNPYYHPYRYNRDYYGYRYWDR